jgi:DNA-binding LacI/PurR family transcriptional regulator
MVGGLLAKRVTLRDVARKVGVSHVAVSLALRNDPSISLQRRVEIKQAAEQMGYRPDPLLSSLAVYRRSQRPSRVGGALAWINHWDQPESLRQHKEFDSYWQGASEAAQRFGYHLDDIRWPMDCSAKRFERILLARGVRGVLVPPHRGAPDWGDFDWNKFSIIRFGLSVQTPDSNLVTSDQSRAVGMALARIHEYGYERIGLVVPVTYDRRLGGNYYGGFCWGQKILQLKHGLPPLMTDEAAYKDQPDKAMEALRKWLARHKPDAILTAEVQVPAMLQQLGYRIPRDIAVAGTSGDVPVDAGINQHSEDIGRIAVEMLVKQININERGVPPTPYRILVESHWVDGASMPRRVPGGLTVDHLSGRSPR